MESIRIIERKVKDVRIGDVLVRRRNDRLVVGINSYFRIGYHYNLYYSDGTSDNLYENSSVRSKTPRRRKYAGNP